MPLDSEASTLVQFIIRLIPTSQCLLWTFDENKSFGDLKKDLEKKHKVKKGEYYIEMNDHVMKDDMIMKDNGVRNDSNVNVIRNDCIKIKLIVKNWRNESEIIEKRMVVSDFKIIKSNENKEVNNEEIKVMIDLLKDETSDQLSILEDLNTILDIFDDKFYEIGMMYMEMGFLSSIVRIFEKQKDDEKIINYLVIILNRINNVKKEGENILKPTDLVDIFYNILKFNTYNNNNININKIKDAMKIIVIMTKKYPSDVINNNNIKNSYRYFLPSNVYSYININNIYTMFKVIIKEEAIKKGEKGSEIIEEILFIGEMIIKNKDIIYIKEELINEIHDLIKIGKEKGFEGKVWNNENELIGEEISFVYKDIFEDNNNNSNEEGLIKEEEKIKKFCDYVTSHSLDVQIHFILILSKRISNNSKCLNSRKNGLFLYYYLPLLFKIYHFEEILPMFLMTIKRYYGSFPLCYEYLVKLYNELIERMMKKSKEIEINEENIIIIIFLWSVINKGRMKEKEIKFLIDSSVKILEWLAKNEKEKEKKEMKENVNKKESIFGKSLDNIDYCNSEDKKKIGELLLEIVKNHLKNERDIINKENKKKIIEYIIFSYSYDFNTSGLLSLSSPSFPFSNDTLVSILNKVDKYFTDINNKELMKKDIYKYAIEVLNNYKDIMTIIDECDIKKEIESELMIEWNNYIINNIKEKISFCWYNINFFLIYYFELLENSSFKSENNNIVRTIIDFNFKHSGNDMYNYKEKEKNNIKDRKEIISIRPFLIDYSNRKYFINIFILTFTNSSYYSIYNIYYLVRKSEEGCNIINILMKELSGEIVDRIKKREGNNIRKERRSYEREKSYDIFEDILRIIKKMMRYTFENKNNVYLGTERNKDSYKGKEKEIKEDKEYISDIIEEEDIRECLILCLKYYQGSNIRFCDPPKYSNNALYYLLSMMELQKKI